METILLGRNQLSLPSCGERRLLLFHLHFAEGTHALRFGAFLDFAFSDQRRERRNQHCPHLFLLFLSGEGGMGGWET